MTSTVHHAFRPTLLLNGLALVFAAIIMLCELAFGWFGPNGYGPMALAILASVLPLISLTIAPRNKLVLFATLATNVLMILVAVLLLVRVGYYAGWFGLSLVTLVAATPLVNILTWRSRWLAVQTPSGAL